MRNIEYSLDFEGYALRRDLDGFEWKKLFEHLNNDQNSFLEKEFYFRSPEYRWPSDSLNTWSRIWEYPFSFFHLRNLAKNKAGKGNLKVADIGSGVTFFPFSVARLGYDVTCVDIDPVCSLDLPKAAEIIDSGAGSIDVKIIKNNGAIPIENSSQDAVYCISVLEHIPEFSKTIEEISRILKKDGIFILTIDVDLRGNSEIGIDGYNKLHSCLSSYFDTVLPFRQCHPSEMLTTLNSPIRMPGTSRWNFFKRLLKEIIHNRFWKYDVRVGVHLAVFATVLKKRV